MVELLCITLLLKISPDAGICRLPLVEPPPAEYAALPEYFLANVADLLLFLARTGGSQLNALDPWQLSVFARVLVYFVGR
jgi:hypothetical protein